MRTIGHTIPFLLSKGNLGKGRWCVARAETNDYAACLALVPPAAVSKERLPSGDEASRLFSDSLSPAIDQAISQTSATIVPRPMTSTAIRHLR